jgi:FixJ family two-component response regulator
MIALSTLQRVAIIDDDESVRATTDSLVRSLGCVADMFPSAEAFLQSDRIDKFACVIADVQMPGMSGVQLQDQLRAGGSRVPFIFFTAFPDERTRAKALAAGATCYLTKPCDADTLIRCFEVALTANGGGSVD